MLYGRCCHRSIFDYPYIYVTGGKQSKKIDDGITKCERYHVIKKEWTEIAEMKEKKHSHLIFEFGKIYIAGGYEE